MREFWREIVHALEGGAPVELVSVVASTGSTPRGAGAMMALFRDGRSTGTIGGGNVEFEAQNRGGALLAAGRDALESFQFRQGEAASLGMVCGGNLTVHFQYLPAGGATAAVLRPLVETENTATWLLRRLEGETVTAMDTVNAATQLNVPLPQGLLGPKTVFQEGWLAVPVIRAGKTYIFGGGHVSQALSVVLASVGFRPVIYDDRPEFTTPALFPGAETICAPFSQVSTRVKVTADDDVVVMTRGHQADYEVLAQVLRSGAKYLGCIGSRAKLAVCRKRLEEAGFTPEEYARLHAPIGLAIGAETPAEIAVSVAAEMIAVRAGKLP